MNSVMYYVHVVGLVRFYVLGPGLLVPLHLQSLLVTFQ